MTSFLSRHRNKFAWIGGLFGAGMMMYQYGQWKWSEFQTERQVEITARANIKRRFEQNLQDCTFVISSLLTTVSEHLFEMLNVESITANLQSLKSPASDSSESIQSEPSGSNSGSKSKMELWHDIKIESFTRTIASIYILSLLTLFTHLQLALLGRSFYLDSVLEYSLKDHEETIKGNFKASHSKFVSEETEREYLTFSWYLLHIGWEQCVSRVRACTERVLANVSLKQGVTFESLMDIIEQIRNQVESDDFEPLLKFRLDSFLLPKEGHEDIVLREGGVVVEEGGEPVKYVLSQELRNLLDETRDFLESSDTENVLKSCLDSGFELLGDQFRPTFYGPDLHLSHTIMNLPSDEDLSTSKSLPLAGILPLVTRSVHQVLNGVPNVFLDSLSSNPKLYSYAMIAYSSWE